jgi:hypothetical protein
MSVAAKDDPQQSHAFFRRRNEKMTPQRCQSPDGERGNIAALVQEFGKPAWYFESRQRRGWLINGGKPLPTEPLANGRSFLISLVRAAIEEEERPTHVVKGGEWLDRFTFKKKKNGRLYYTDTGGHTVFGLPLRTGRLCTRFRCRYLGGRKIKKIVNVPYPFRGPQARTTVYLGEDFQRIKDGRSSPQPLGDWATNPSLMKLLGVSSGFTGYWRKQKSRRRPGKALRKRRGVLIKTQRNGGSPGPVQPWEYYVPDARDILAGKETEPKYLGTGRPSNPLLSKKERDKRAVSFLTTFFSGGPALSDQILREAAKLGINRISLNRDKEELDVRHQRKYGPPGGSPVFWYLPHHKPPAVVERHGVEDEETARPTEFVVSHQSNGEQNGHAPTNGVPSVPASPQNGQRRRRVTATMQDVLDCLFDGKAWSEAYGWSVDEIAQKLRRQSKTIGNAVTDLKGLELVGSGMGRGSTVWLTEKGKDHTAALRK